MESPRRRRGGAEQPTCWSSVLKVLCCVDTASAGTARRRDSGETVFSEEHDSPLVARAGATNSSGDVLPRFRAPTPPPFESRANGAGDGFPDLETRADVSGETSGEDDLRRDSESSRGAASDGERDGVEKRERLWREKRGLLRKSAKSHESSHETADAARAFDAFDAKTSSARDVEPTPARRRSFDGETQSSKENGKKKTHHRTESEPVPGYVPPRLDSGSVRLEEGEADDLVSSLRKSAFGALGVSARGDGNAASEAFKEHLKKTVLLGQHARSASGVSVTSTLCDEDSCPTCFEAYDAENPKMPLVCGHHFHLACVYEWYERSDKCPVCEAKMEFDPSTGWSLEG